MNLKHQHKTFGWPLPQLLVAASLLSAFSGAQDIAIDEFNTAFSLSSLAATNGLSYASPSSLGGEIDIWVENYDSQSGPALLSGNIAPQLGQLLFRLAPSVQGAATIQWDGVDGDPLNIDATGLGGADFTVGGSKDALLLTLVSTSHDSGLFLRAYSGSGNAS